MHSVRWNQPLPCLPSPAHVTFGRVQSGMTLTLTGGVPGCLEFKRGVSKRLLLTRDNYESLLKSKVFLLQKNLSLLSSNDFEHEGLLASKVFTQKTFIHQAVQHAPSRKLSSQIPTSYSGPRYRGTLLIKNIPPPSDYHMTPGICLL